MAVASALVVLFLFCGISEYARLNLIAAGVRDAVQEAILSTVNDNYDDVYHGVREGYSGGYYPSGGGWDESLDYGDVYGFLDNLLGMEDYGSYHVKLVDGGRKEEYRISGCNYTECSFNIGQQQTLPGRRHVSTPGAGPFRREPPAGHADPYESTGSLYSRVLMG